MYIEEEIVNLKKVLLELKRSVDATEKATEKAPEKAPSYPLFNDELLTTTEVGKLLKCNRDSVCKLIDAGLIPYMKLGSRKVRISTLNEFMKKYEGWDLSDPINPKPL